MKSDYWEESGQVFVCKGMRYGLTSGCRTICIGSINDIEALQESQQGMMKAESGSLIPPTVNVTDIFNKQLALRMDQVQGLTESLAISLEDNRTAGLTHRRSKLKHGRPKLIVQ